MTPILRRVTFYGAPLVLSPHEYTVTRRDKVGCDWIRPDGRPCNLARIDPLHRQGPAR